MTDSFRSYLLAKRSVDDRALNRRVLSRFEAALASASEGEASADDPTQILEIGAGIGTMIPRLAGRGCLPPKTVYRAVDIEDRNIEFATRAVPDWLEDAGFSAGRDGDRIAAVGDVGERSRTDGRSRRRLEFVLEVGDALALESEDVAPLSENAALGRYPSPRATSGGVTAEGVDAVIAAAFLDLVDLETALESIRALLRPGGVLYAPLTYDGITSFTPAHPLDDRVESLYNGHMDDVRDRPGSSRAGRDLLAALPDAGYEPLTAGAADWAVLPRDGSYRHEEDVFLEYILETVAGALADYELASDHPIYTDWLEARRDQLARGELGFVGHHLDVLARRTDDEHRADSDHRAGDEYRTDGG